MMWLHKDLEERPNDPRTVYYIGHAHLEQAGPNPAQVKTSAPRNPTQTNVCSLQGVPGMCCLGFDSAGHLTTGKKCDIKYPG